MQGMSGMILVIVLFVLMYLFMIRPQKKRQKQHADLLKQLKKGDHVVTISHLHGIVNEIDRGDRAVSLNCDGLNLTFDLDAIATVRNHKVPDSKNAPGSGSAQSTASQSAKASGQNQKAKV